MVTCRCEFVAMKTLTLRVKAATEGWDWVARSVARATHL